MSIAKTAKLLCVTELKMTKMLPVLVVINMGSSNGVVRVCVCVLGSSV